MACATAAIAILASSQPQAFAAEVFANSFSQEMSSLATTVAKPAGNLRAIVGSADESLADPFAGIFQDPLGFGSDFGVSLHGSLAHEGGPNMQQVAIVALASLAVVLALDVVGHLAEQHIDDEDEREFFDWVIDGACAFCFFMISSLWYGLIQEYIMTMEYSTGRFPSAAFLVLMNRLLMIPFAAVLLVILGQTRLNMSATVWTSIPGVVSGVDALLGEKALLYITFPVQAVFKSCAIMPTMAMNTLMNGEVAGWKEYLVACFISACVAGFSLANKKDGGAPDPNMALGIILMSIFLILGAVTSTTQKKIFNKFPGFTSVQMMLISSVWSCVFSAVLVLCGTGVSPLFTFLAQNPECIKHLMAFGLSGTLVCYFIFYIIKHQGPVALTVMGVVKTIASIVLSSLVYNHPLTLLAKLCAAGTCCGVLVITYLSLMRHRREAAQRRAGHLKNVLVATKRLQRAIRSRRAGSEKAPEAQAKAADTTADGAKGADHRYGTFGGTRAAA